MKILVIFLLGLAAGALGLYLYRLQPASASESSTADPNLTATARSAAHTAATRTRQIAVNASEAMNEKIEAWHLTPDDIKADLARTSQIVRANATRAGEKITDARIVTVIKAKFVLDRGLSVHAIEVVSQEGDVTLTGSVASAVLIGQAVAHALDTEGVRHVVA